MKYVTEGHQILKTSHFCHAKHTSSETRNWFHQTSPVSYVKELLKKSQKHELTNHKHLTVQNVYLQTLDEMRACTREADWGNSSFVCDPSSRLATPTRNKLQDLLAGLGSKMESALCSRPSENLQTQPSYDLSRSFNSSRRQRTVMNCSQH